MKSLKIAIYCDLKLHNNTYFISIQLHKWKNLYFCHVAKASVHIHGPLLTSKHCYGGGGSVGC